VAVNKLVSGVAARVIRPVGLADVVPGGEEAFLRPVAVRNLPAVDRQVEGKLLEDLNVSRVGQLTAFTLARLAAAFGRSGDLLYRQARGIDDAPVRPPSRAVVIEESTRALPSGEFPEDTNDDAALLAALHVLVERGCRRLRRMGMLAGEAGVSIRYSDGAGAWRRVPLRPPIDLDLSLFARLQAIFTDVVARRGRVRSMTLRLARIGTAPAQMSLFPDHDGSPPAVAPRRLDPARERSLMKALDRIRKRYAEGAVVSGRVPLPAVPPAA
jgi:nucleotidyltransferase/DNA polymerase involved in DNA repair